MKTVLITGATGAIGSALVPLFFKEPETSITLLIRADSKKHLEEKLVSLFEYWSLDPGDPETSSGVKAVAGDVSKPKLGLSPNEYEKLVHEVTHIIHSAGNVKLNQSMEEARLTSVVSIQNVVALANSCRKNGQFVKMDYVSTIGVAGSTPGLILEKPFSSPPSFRNTYEASKAEAENYVLSAMGKGLPATIHRPSMVVGDSKTGQIIHFQVFYHLCEFFSGRYTWGILPKMRGTTLDIIPVDYVAKALYLSSQRSDAIGRIFHLCSGPGNSVLITDLIRWLRGLFQSFGEKLPSEKYVGTKLVRFFVPILSFFSNGEDRKRLETLPYFLSYIGPKQDFQNEMSRAYFSKLGLEIPPLSTYLKRLFHYYLILRSDFLASRDQAEKTPKVFLKRRTHHERDSVVNLSLGR